MATTITVQGSHTVWIDAERATLQVSAAFDGPEREDVFARATTAAATVSDIIAPLVDAGAGPVTWWTSDRVNVWSERPWNTEGARLPLVYHAAIGVRAEFRDVDALSRVVEQLAVLDGISIGQIEWDLTDERRRSVTDEVRAAAVADAVHKAAGYAAAAGVGSPAVVALADPGMLGDAPSDSSAPSMERTAFRAAMDAGGGAPLTLTPERIQVTASVDVRFVSA